MNILETPISHETQPHCCGCWNIVYDPEIGLPKLVCNECGIEVPLQIPNEVKAYNKSITEHPDTQRLIKQMVLLQTKYKKLKDAIQDAAEEDESGCYVRIAKIWEDL